MSAENQSEHPTAEGQAVGSSDLLASYRVGDVFQINEKHGRKGWIGALVLTTEIKSFGIQGFVVHVVTHDKQQRAYIRLAWDEIDYIGHAVLVPDANDV